ncbi:MAG: hypothetical protein CVV52_07140 [Spirochaetae bacterium HGW-Spirochaetae-8]|jgi:hypothetical protein|nr:MAG: hypothetical protein CVV52_07140 [Spirochaetae bacterium HGW-Spirochaetae-8]
MKDDLVWMYKYTPSKNQVLVARRIQKKRKLKEVISTSLPPQKKMKRGGERISVAQYMNRRIKKQENPTY